MRVREIEGDEGRRLLRIIRRGTGSVVTWRRPQMVLLSAQSMPVVKIADVTFTGADRVRDVKTRKKRTQFLEFCRHLRSLYPPDVRIAISCDNCSPHLSTTSTSASPTTPAYVRSSPGPTRPDQRLPERPVLSPRSWF